MRPHLREFLELCAQTLVCPEPIVEIGAFQVPGQESIADLRTLFPGKRYIGCDMRSGQGVDRIENIHHLSFRSGEVGTFILADTLEHVAEPHSAMHEIHRCLRDDGVAIYSSVMYFPIHGHPNDYWRFTPEAFRMLGRHFPCNAIFYSGPAEFPHTVCGVAAKKAYDVATIKQLAGRLKRLEKIAPLILERRTAAIVKHLVRQLATHADRTAPPQTHAGFDRLAQPDWYLVSGQWITGWAAVEGVREVEIVAGDKIIHRARLDRARPEIAAHLKLPDNDALIGFCDQVDLSDIGDFTGVLQMHAIDRDGQHRTICESAAGVALGSIKMETKFVMHSLDERPARDAATIGQKLVEEIRSRGEPVNVDLGCGFRKQGNLGIDVTSEGTQADLICQLGFEPIPLEDEVADSIYCRDFLEHIPKAYYSESERRLRYPIIELMNEIWRILKPGGTFTSFTPCYPAPEIHRDPTHLSVWTLESMPYFCGQYPVAKLYGVHTNFELIENRLDGFYLHAVLRKPALA